MLRPNDYKTFESFVFKGIKFLALETGQNTEIYNEKIDFYGSFYGRKSFQKLYEKKGESLNSTEEMKRLASEV